MVTEQDKALEALRIAIDMENDGKECYQQASQNSGNDVGRKLMQSLSLEEMPMLVALHSKTLEVNCSS